MKLYTFVLINLIYLTLVGNPLSREAPIWMANRVHQEFKIFEKLKISTKELDRLNHHRHVIRYIIKNNKIETILSNEYLNNNPSKHTIDSRVDFFTRALNEISKLVELPNLDFLVDFGDGPSIDGPVFAICKHKYSQTIILIPGPEYLSTLEDWRDSIIKGSQVWPWEKKFSKAFWRGATKGALYKGETKEAGVYTLGNLDNFPRFLLSRLSKNNPDLIDAKFTDLVQINQEAAQYIINLGLNSNYYPIIDNAKFKYLISVDGNTYPTSLSWQLFSNSVILKQDSPYIQWYSNELKPFVHYVPVAHDFSDIINKIYFLNDNQDLCLEIIKNANNFANNNLQYNDILYYIYLVLIEYSKYQTQ